MSGTLGQEATGSTGDEDWLHCTFELHLQHMENFENFTVKNEATTFTNCPPTLGTAVRIHMKRKSVAISNSLLH